MKNKYTCLKYSLMIFAFLSFFTACSNISSDYSVGMARNSSVLENNNQSKDNNDVANNKNNNTITGYEKNLDSQNDENISIDEAQTNRIPSVRITDLGEVQYTAKTLGAHYFYKDNNLYLIGGTEVSDGSHAQLFVYDLENNKLIFDVVISPAICIMSFCQTNNIVYFGTISRNPEDGCDLYAYDIYENKYSKIFHFNEIGIYAIDWDKNDYIYIATSGNARLYKYSLEQNDLTLLLENFTDEIFIRSMKYVDGICYLGIGSNADLIAMNVSTLEWNSILPDALKENNTFVYNINSIYGELLFLLKNDNGIYSYSPDKMNFRRITNYKQTSSQEEEEKEIESFSWIDLEGDIILFGSRENFKQYSLDGLRSFYDIDKDTMYTIDSSCIVYKYINGKIKETIDLAGIMRKSYIMPIEFLAYDNVLYFPGRRFIVWNRNNEKIRSYIIQGEPQASTMSNADLYIGIYPQCKIYRYPLSILDGDLTEDLNSENYLIATIDGQCRPTQMAISKDGNYLVMGSDPLYGKFGGAASVYNIEANFFLYTNQVINKQIIRTVSRSDKVESAVWLGTMPYGENTNPPYLEIPARVILWDNKNEKSIKNFIIKDSVRKIISIEEIADKVYITTEESYLYQYNIDDCSLQNINSKDGILHLLKLNDNKLLGINSTNIFYIDPITLETTILADGFFQLSNLVQDSVTGKIYFFDKTKLMEMELSWTVSGKEGY